MGQLLSTLAIPPRKLFHLLWFILFTKIRSWGELAVKLTLAISGACTGIGWCMLTDPHSDYATIHLVIETIITSFVFLMLYHVYIFWCNPTLPGQRRIGTPSYSYISSSSIEQQQRDANAAEERVHLATFERSDIRQRRDNNAPLLGTIAEEVTHERSDIMQQSDRGSGYLNIGTASAIPGSSALTEVSTNLPSDLHSGLSPGERSLPTDMVDLLDELKSTIYFVAQNLGLEDRLRRTRQTVSESDIAEMQEKLWCVLDFQHSQSYTERTLSRHTLHDMNAPSTSYQAASTSSAPSTSYQAASTSSAPSTSYQASGESGAGWKKSAQDIVQSTSEGPETLESALVSHMGTQQARSTPSLSQSPIRPPVEKLWGSTSEIEAKESTLKRRLTKDAAIQVLSLDPKRSKPASHAHRTESVESRVTDISSSESQELPEESTGEENPEDASEQSGSDSSKQEPMEQD